jgi:outer membrane protein
MRTTTATLALAAALAGLAAVPAPARAEQKIAYVDLQRALNEIEEGKAAKARLKAEFDQKQKIIDEKKAEFDKLRADFEKQAVVMSEDARREKQGELEKKGMELQGFFVQLQKELSEREREATRGIFDKMHSVVKEIADSEGISLVTQAEALVYAAPSLDITNELVRRYNARFKATQAAATPADKKAKAESAGDKKPKKETK